MSDTVAERFGSVLRGLLASTGGFRDLSRLAVAQIAPMPIQMGLSLLTAVVLVPSERGSAVFVVSAGVVGSTILFGSFHVGAVAALKAGDVPAYRRARLAIIATAALFGLGAFWVSAARPEGFGLYTAGNLSLILAGLSLSVLFLNFSRTLQGLGLTASYRNVNLLYAVSYATGSVVALGLLGMRDARAVTYPWLIALVVTVGVTSWQFRVRIRGLAPVEGITSTPLEPIRSSLTAHGASLSQQLAYRADLFILGVVSTPALIGVYTLSISLGEMLWIIPEIVALSIFADNAIRHGSAWRADLVRRVRSTMVVTAGLSLLLVGGAAVLFLVLLPAYRESFLILVLLIPGMVVASGGRLIMAALTARDERRLLVIAAVGTLLLSLLYVPAIVLFDVYGAALVAPVVYVGQLLLLWQLLKRARR